MRIIVNHQPTRRIEDQEVEIVERKGIGHPDTLADAIAEKFSMVYSRFCLKEFGRIANHWIDKCLILGGESAVDFGRSRIIRPITVYIIGKVTDSVGDVKIPVRELGIEIIRSHFATVFPTINVKTHLALVIKTNSAVGAGRSPNWYRPINIKDLYQDDNHKANDAVICTAYAPLSATECLAVRIERHLNSAAFKKDNPETGSDIKILCIRTANDLHLNVSIPFIGALTPSRTFYEAKKQYIFDFVNQLVESNIRQYSDTKIEINTRDSATFAYLTAVGTVADLGDCGVVGRGNRITGVIAPTREMCIEAPHGKNPVYHGGKLYNVLSLKIAQEIYSSCGCENYVNIVTQTGRNISDPLMVAVKVSAEQPEVDDVEINRIVRENINDIDQVTQELTNGLLAEERLVK